MHFGERFKSGKRLIPLSEMQLCILTLYVFVVFVGGGGVMIATAKSNSKMIADTDSLCKHLIHCKEHKILFMIQVFHNIILFYY